jgi:hypothetical protein
MSDAAAPRYVQVCVQDACGGRADLLRGQREGGGVFKGVGVLPIEERGSVHKHAYRGSDHQALQLSSQPRRVPAGSPTALTLSGVRG